MNIGVQTGEIWGDIKDFEGLYQVSTWGRVRSIRTGKLRATYINNKGYECIGLYRNKKEHKFLVHRLVAETFILNPYSKPEVNHIDEDKQNNYVYNLEWCTRSENIAHSWEKPVEATNTDGKTYYFTSAKECGVSLGLYPNIITACLKGRRKTHKGYTFRYLESSDRVNE